MKRRRKLGVAIANLRFLADLRRFQKPPAEVELPPPRAVAPRFSGVETGSGCSSAAGWDVMSDVR